MALWRILRDAAVRHPDRVALTIRDRDFTYAELDCAVEWVAAGLRFQGLGTADRVVTVLGNTIEHLTLLLGCYRAGLVTVPMAPWSIPAHIRYAVRTSGARGIVAPTHLLNTVFDGHEEIRPDVTVTVGDPDPPRGVMPWEIIEAGPGDAPEPPDPKVDHLGLIVYTSGTTSRPKAVVHTQDRMARRAAAFAEEVGLTADDVAFVAHQICRPLPLLAQVIATLQVGGRMVLHDGLTKGFWKAYAAGPPKTFVITLPAVTVELLADPAAATVDHSHLRLWLAGGDSVSAELQTKFHAATGKNLVEMCGMTETGFYAINSTKGPVRVGSIGREMKGISIRIVDAAGNDVQPGEVGEILLKTPEVMVGYWNDTAETFRVIREGWLHTGDLARRDADGYLWFAGRSKDMINRGGQKVAPPMVEAALAEHPAIASAVVVPTPDATCGQVPFGFLALRPDAERPTDVDLKAWLADKLEPASIPVGFAVVTEWPRTYENKLDRARLAWMAANGGVVL